MPCEDRWLRKFPSAERGAHFPSTDPLLLELTRTGTEAEQRAALAEVARRYYKPVYRFFQRALRLPEGALSDLTQDFFRRLLEQDVVQRFKQESSFRAFLKGICKNDRRKWIEDLFRRRRIGSLGGAEDDAPEIAAAPDELERGIDEDFRRLYREEALRRTQARLAGRGKDVYYTVLQAMLVPDGEQPPKYGELAARLGLSLTDVRNYLYEARRILRAELIAFAKERSPDWEADLRELGLWAGPRRKEKSG